MSLRKKAPKKQIKTHEFQESESGAVLTLRSKTIRTLEGALASGKVDEAKYEVERWVLNKWDMASRVKQSESGCETLAATELWQVKVWLKPRAKRLAAVDTLIEKLGSKSQYVKLRKKKRNAKQRRMLEISIMDPHMGLNCDLPRSEQKWDLDLCEQFYLFAIDELMRKAEPHGPFEQVVWVFGNDFLHVDSDLGTTRGTPQPEAVEKYTAAARGEQLAIAAVDAILAKLNQGTKLHIVQVPGNHDEYSSYFLGRIINAYYRNDARVTVDASAAPFKKFRYGTNLLGFEHGSNINALRLAALMANEWRQDWAETEYREWHCGDQHRKGSSKPSVFEEQGVSIEYLPALVAPNSWHRMKAFNYQKRAAKAFVWDYSTGEEARLSTNISSYSGKYL